MAKEQGTLDVDDVIRKVQKLHRHSQAAAEAGHHAESENYASAMRKMLENYKLSMTQIDFEAHLKSEPVTESLVNWRDHGLKNKSKRCEWIEQLTHVVAKAHGCRFLVHSGTNLVTLVGRESSRKVAEFVLVTLVRTAEKLAEYEYCLFYAKVAKEGQTYKAKGYKANFLNGFIARISCRFDEEMKAGADSSTAIVRFNTEYNEAVAWLDQREDVKKAGALDRRVNLNGPAYGRGVEVANELDLKKKAMAEEEKKTRLLS